MKADLHDLYLELWLREREANNIKWTQKDGKEIPINQMSQKHLINTINMLTDKEDEFYDILDKFDVDALQ